MKKYSSKTWFLFLAVGILASGLTGCATLKGGPPAAELKVTPDKIFLTPDLLKNPPVFSGSGFGPKEIVVIEMILPPGVTVKGVPPGENAALGNATTDEKGDFEIKMGAMSILNTLFQVEWTPLIKPDFKQAKPLPPGTYEALATGMVSERVGRTKLTILPPPEKK